MAFKKKLGLGIMLAVLGIALIGGGTFAYFSDTAEQTNTFASGTIDLEVDPTTNVEISNIKPGDWTLDTFKLINTGSLDIKEVHLHTAYTVTKNNGEPVENSLANAYADAIMVDFLYNTGEVGMDGYKVFDSKSLLELRDMTPENLAKEWGIKYKEIFGKKVPWGFKLVDGIEAGTGPNTEDNFFVKFRFNDTGEPQNELQDLHLTLNWTFEAFQEDGEFVD